MAAGCPNESNALIENQLNTSVDGLETSLQSDILTFSGYLYDRSDLFVRDAVEWRKQQRPKRTKLAFFLETGGGYIQVVQRIVTILRKHYNRVDFYVLDAAMSAGTVLVMSGDAIHMDYYSVLGPIDPQVPKPGGGYVPGLGYLREFDKLMAKSKDGPLTTAEMTYLCSKFDPAELYQYEHARLLSVYLIERWLAKYKFKDWKKTRTRKLTVDSAMRKERAHKIGEILNNTEKWHSHGHGISMSVLQSKEVGLQIEDFGKDKELHRRIRDYWTLLSDHRLKLKMPGVIHTKGWYRHFGW